jgi:integrase
MAKKNQLTTCNALEWEDFIFLIEALKRKQDFTTLMIVTAGGYFGLRISDIRFIRWKDLIDKSQFEIIERKTSKRRSITINPSYSELIKYVFEQGKFTKESLIAAGRKGRALSIQYINRLLHKVFSENNINAGNGSTHTLRKTFGRRVWSVNNKSESSLILLSKVFNHSSITITRAYLGITDREISNVYLNL